MSPTTTPPDVQTQILALVQAQAAAREQATTTAVTLARNSAAEFTGWYDSGQITDWAVGIAAQIEALQRFLAQSTDAYLARVLSLITGRTVRPVGAVQVADLRSGVTHAGAYGRAADVYRWQQSLFDQSARSLLTTALPRPFDLISPVEAAVQRVEKVADLDAQLAVRAQSQVVMAAQPERAAVTGYRRVIHPEESRGGSCGLCVAASHRVYGVNEPLPIHPGCNCTTLPLTDGYDPGALINKADLNRIYARAGGTGRQKLAAIRYQIDEHGELGPVLNPAGQKVRTARQASGDENPNRRAKSAAQKLVEIRRVRDSLNQALPKARELANSDPKQWGDYLTKLETRIHDLDQQLAA